MNLITTTTLEGTIPKQVLIEEFLKWHEENCPNKTYNTLEDLRWDIWLYFLLIAENRLYKGHEGNIGVHIEMSDSFLMENFSDLLIKD